MGDAGCSSEPRYADADVWLPGMDTARGIPFVALVIDWARCVATPDPVELGLLHPGNHTLAIESGRFGSRSRARARFRRTRGFANRGRGARGVDSQAFGCAQVRR